MIPSPKCETPVSCSVAIPRCRHCCAEPTPVQRVVADTGSGVQPPVAMLGEALEHIGAAAQLVTSACGREPLVGRVQKALGDAAALVRTLSHVAGAQAPTCWQCEAVLGTTEACTTCAAKRLEGR